MYTPMSALLIIRLLLSSAAVILGCNYLELSCSYIGGAIGFTPQIKSRGCNGQQSSKRVKRPNHVKKEIPVSLFCFMWTWLIECKYLQEMNTLVFNKWEIFCRMRRRVNEKWKSERRKSVSAAACVKRPPHFLSVARLLIFWVPPFQASSIIHHFQLA